MDRKGKDGFTLVEAMLACVLLVIVLVPALSAFRAHIAASTRQAQDLATAIAIDDFANRIEYEVSMTNLPSATSKRSGTSVLTVSDPEEIFPAIGAASLVQFDIAARPLPDHQGPSRRLPLYLIAPVATNKAAR